MKTLAIVIPCYNEAKRFQTQRFSNFLTKRDGVSLFYVDDGSSDTTSHIIRELKGTFPKQVYLITHLKNKGKAEAVRTGMGVALQNESYMHFAFLDADLSTSLEECYEIATKVNETKAFVFGSRIKKLDNNIQRKKHRFVIGRVIATFISNMLKLPIYDSQCGCKVFRRDWALIAFKDSFKSTWLFDVEIFYRFIRHFGREVIQTEIEEVPLKDWVDTEDSKVSLLYGLKVWFDLIKIYRCYK